MSEKFVSFVVDTPFSMEAWRLRILAISAERYVRVLWYGVFLLPESGLTAYWLELWIKMWMAEFRMCVLALVISSS